jgi:uncharacterized protein DUF5056
MESPDLNSSSFEADDELRLAAFLRQAVPEVPDEGFSQQVLAALPPRKPSRSISVRSLACTVAAVAGMVLACQQIVTVGGFGVINHEVYDQFAQLHIALGQGAGPVAGLGIWVALAVTAGSLWYVFHGELRRGVKGG